MNGVYVVLLDAASPTVAVLSQTVRGPRQSGALAELAVVRSTARSGSERVLGGSAAHGGADVRTFRAAVLLR